MGAPAASVRAETANPASGFYAGGLIRGLAATLRISQRVAPATATRLALRLFCTPMPMKRAARRLPMPAAWQAQPWAFEHGTMVAYRHPATAGAPVVLLVHGWAGSATQMLPLAQAAAAAGLDPVLLDFPAHGRSDGWRASLPQFVRALWAASARLGPLHGIVAHSLGALAAAHAVANGLPAQRLVLVSTSPSPSLFIRWFCATLRLGEALPMRMGSALERFEGVPLAHFDAAWLGPRLTRPTLILHDEADRISPLTVGRRLADAVPGAAWHPTRDLGHRRILAHPGVADAVVTHLGTGGPTR